MISKHKGRLKSLIRKGSSRLGCLAIFGALLLCLPLLAACQPGALEPPRAATVTAQAELTPTLEPRPMISNAPTATPGGTISEMAEAESSDSGGVESLTVWASVSDNSELDVLEEGANEFTSETGIQVELVQVASRLLPQLMQSAVISGTLPDLVLHPVEYTHGWRQQGILDPEAATTVLERLGEGTFEPDALAQFRIDSTSDLVAALPSSGWQQVVLYRSDWFDELGLSRPDSFSDLAAAAEAIFEDDSPVSGLIAPTDSSLISTQHVFEHMAIANGCRLVAQDGEVLLLHPACLEALEFYRALINGYSPVGLQTDISALNGYLSGRTGIIIASPAVLPIIAGLAKEVQPSCPDCATPDFLARNTGIVTTLMGDGEFAEPASFSALTALGITTAGDKDAPMAFAEYWFNTLYPRWITVNPERKVPLRRGVQDDETIFLDLWQDAPLVGGSATLADVYGPEAATLLSQDIAAGDRWALSRGQGPVLSTIYEELLFAPLLQDMLSGYFTSSETIVEMYLTAVGAIPGYSYPIQVAPSPTP